MSVENHITFSGKLPDAFKQYMKKTFGLDCDNICYKQNERGEVCEDAKIVLSGLKIWEDMRAISLSFELRAAKAEGKLTTPTCVWDDNNPDGESYTSLKELAENYSKDVPVSLIKVGQAVQIDNTYIVVNHVDKTFTEYPALDDAKKAVLSFVAHKQAVNNVVESLIPVGVKRKQPSTAKAKHNGNKNPK